jgi:hypothetical protein
VNYLRSRRDQTSGLKLARLQARIQVKTQTQSTLSELCQQDLQEGNTFESDGQRQRRGRERSAVQ